jgi:hypothetical protein
MRLYSRCYIYIKNYKNKQNKNKRLIDLQNCNLTSKYDRGWIRQEMNMIIRKWTNKNGNEKKHLRNPPGKDLAHEYGREKAKGYGYEHTNFKLIADHRIQHKFDNNGKKNKEREFDIKIIAI